MVQASLSEGIFFSKPRMICSQPCDDIYRSKDFRPSYGRLAELRAIVPPGTPFMACTATATTHVRKELLSSLEMVDYESVITSPNRPNIFYAVKPRVNVVADFTDLLDTLRSQSVHAPRVIIYCRSLNACSVLFAHFHFELGSASYYPIGAPQKSYNRLFGMYHACTPQSNKDVILDSLAITDGVVRVVFATIALGMGVDMRGVNTIIHYGAPRSIEDYFQESGRGGRDGGNATSTIYWKKSDCPVRKKPSTIEHHEAIIVRQYLENTSTCRRRLLLD